ncbi:MAG TPA: outer membrane beta-barrel protein [Thermoanaerobaculia bacterium]|nr:outer membrane beta-barrel protein [Thermoanaerobaculia bacterium]
MTKSAYTLRLAVLSLAAAGFVGSAQAASAQGQFQITPTAGYRTSGQLTATNRDFLNDADIEVDKSSVFGVIVDIPFGQSGFGFEVLANRQESAFTLDPGIFEPSEQLGDVEISYLHGGIYYEWGGGQVVPFISATGGVTRIDPKFSDLEAEDRASASLGGGVKIFFNRNLGLRLEGRGYWTDLDARFRDDDDDRRRDRDINQALYQGEASAGLIFAF